LKINFKPFAFHFLLKHAIVNLLNNSTFFKKFWNLNLFPSHHREGGNIFATMKQETFSFPKRLYLSEHMNVCIFRASNLFLCRKKLVVTEEGEINAEFTDKKAELTEL